MKAAYPVILTPGSEYILVSVPDFGIDTQGTDIPDAMEMVRDAIGLMGIDMEDDGETLPTPADAASVRSDSPGAFVTLVDVDFTEYRRRNDLRSVKKNCTLPSWLCSEAEKAGVNFSAVLQAALKRELNITDR